MKSLYKLTHCVPHYVSSCIQQPAHILNEVVMNIRTVYAYNLQRQMNKRFTELTEAEYHRGWRRALVAGLTNGAANCMRLLIFTGVFYYGGTMTSQKKITPRAMMQVNHPSLLMSASVLAVLFHLLTHV